jgi:hypothetical protein
MAYTAMASGKTARKSQFLRHYESRLLCRTGSDSTRLRSWRSTFIGFTFVVDMTVFGSSS